MTYKGGWLKISDTRGVLLATVIFREHISDGIEFFSEPSHSQQLGQMTRPKGYEVERHAHYINKREIFTVQEALFVKSGRIKVLLYGMDEKFVRDIELSTGDVIHLIAGGHGIEFIDDSTVVELKQGPYDDKQQKKYF